MTNAAGSCGSLIRSWMMGGGSIGLRSTEPLSAFCHIPRAGKNQKTGSWFLPFSLGPEKALPLSGCWRTVRVYALLIPRIVSRRSSKIDVNAREVRSRPVVSTSRVSIVVQTLRQYCSRSFNAAFRVHRQLVVLSCKRARQFPWA